MNERESATAWREASHRAAEKVGDTVERALREAAARTWGRGLFRRPWELTANPDTATWRAYHYLGSLGADDHRYTELGVVCHLDPNGNLVGFGIDNGVDFIALHDTSEYGLKRGLEYILKQHPKVRSRDRFVYDHKSRPYEEPRT